MTMANAPESILIIWKKLGSKGCRIPSEVWSLWEPYIQELEEIAALVTQSQGGPVSVAMAREITKRTSDWQRFLRSIRSEAAGISRVENGQIWLDPDALELVVHYIGNDIYVIALIADVPKNDPRPLRVEDSPHILDRVRTIKAFIEQLKQATA